MLKIASDHFNQTQKDVDSSSKLCPLDVATGGESLGVRLVMVEATKLVPLVVPFSQQNESTKTALYCG
jgi:hypothetical protein